LKVQTTLETLNIPIINHALKLLTEVKMKKYIALEKVAKNGTTYHPCPQKKNRLGL
jgi:hypothetical protein